MKKLNRLSKVFSAITIIALFLPISSMNVNASDGRDSGGNTMWLIPAAIAAVAALVIIVTLIRLIIINAKEKKRKELAWKFLPPSATGNGANVPPQAAGQQMMAGQGLSQQMGASQPMPPQMAAGQGMPQQTGASQPMTPQMAAGQGMPQQTGASQPMTPLMTAGQTAPQQTASPQMGAAQSVISQGSSASGNSTKEDTSSVWEVKAFVSLTELGGEQRSFRAEIKDSVMIGRKPPAQIVLDYDKSVSSRHCEIIKRGEAYFLKDLGSINGTAYNGTSVTLEVPIAKEGTLNIGRGQYRLTIEG